MPHITLSQAQAVCTSLSTLNIAGIFGTQVRIVNINTTSTVWMHNDTVYMLVEFSNGDESEHEFSSLDSFLKSCLDSFLKSFK